MNFIEAVKLMRKGKKLRRETYTSGAYFSMYIGIDKGDEVFCYYIDNKTCGYDYIFAVRDFEATDWIILED